jgi:predicted RNA-binding protein
MCMSNAYMDDTLLMESVDILKTDKGKIYLKNLFGEESIVDGTIEEISFTQGRIILKKS